MTDNTANATPQGGQEGAGQTTQTTETKTWFEGYADEDVGYIKNKGWDKEGGLRNMLDSYKNLEKLRGVPEDQLLRMPKNEDDKEGWQKLFNRLGRPESAEKYEYKAPEGINPDEARLKFASDMAHRIGLNKAQFNELVNSTYKYESEWMKDIETKQEQERTAALSKLKDEWGNAYNERLELGKRAVRRFGVDEQTIDKLEKELGTNAAVLKLFASIGDKIQEDKAFSQNDERPFGYSPEQAKADIAALKQELTSQSNSDRLTEYNAGKGTDYEKMQRLLKVAYSG